MVEKSPSVVAVITAGCSPSEQNPFSELPDGCSKALIPIAGRPMIAHVVDALAGSRYVHDIVIVALSPDCGIEFPVPVHYVPDAGGLFPNTEAGITYAQARFPTANAILLSSSDVPTMTPTIVDAFIDECTKTDHDIYYSIVERSVMESRFPGSCRTYIHLTEGDFAGGDLILLNPDLCLSNRALWQNLSNARKQPLKQARMLGFKLFLKLIARRLSIPDAERRALEVLHVRGRALPFPYAEVGMDVDKPFQLDIVRGDMKRRAATYDR
jgi:CTP:molybdopterin cytidylyltransferase MocA